MRAIPVLLTVAAVILSSGRTVTAGSAFALNSAEAGAIINRIVYLKAVHVSDAELATYAFTVNRIGHELTVSASGRLISKTRITGTVPQATLAFERKSLAANPDDATGGVAVSGYVALALRAAQSDRRSLTVPFIALQRSGDFLFIGYEHGGHIFLAESFPSLIPPPVPRQLDGCMPALEFDFSKPDLRVTYFRFHKCS